MLDIQPVIMVQIADRAWTLEALHCACVMARARSAQIALVEMTPVMQPSYLGTELAYLALSESDRMNSLEYQATLEDYGVEFSLYRITYLSLVDAIVEAADYVNAEVVFATIPWSIIPFWQTFQRRQLRRRLARNRREWIEAPTYPRAQFPENVAIEA